MTHGSSAVEVITLAARRGITISTAESLTAGMVAASLADVAGASAVLEGGIVAYQSSVKHKLLGVDSTLLESAGAVDPRVAAAMADGAREVFRTDVGVATTGVAGPSAHDGKPVGTVFTAISGSTGTTTFEHHFEGDRNTIRIATREAVLAELLAELRRGTNHERG